MWPFKKKTLIKKESTPPFKSIICIPGNWVNWNEFILSIVRATDGEYIAAGNILMNAKQERHFSVEFCDQDERMKESFKYAGKVTVVSDDFLEEISSHKNVIYISHHTGNLQEAKHLALAAKAILKAGGIGVKVETAGKAFEKAKWFELLDNFEESNLYKMFVIDSIVDKDGTVFSCGMQNLGFKDTIVSGEEFQSAVNLISIFGYYQIVDEPIIHHMQTFTATIDSPKFRIIEEINQPYKGDQVFENPFGMWRLNKE
jgi:hypothetical protein